MSDLTPCRDVRPDPMSHVWLTCCGWPWCCCLALSSPAGTRALRQDARRSHRRRTKRVSPACGDNIGNEDLSDENIECTKRPTLALAPILCSSLDYPIMIMMVAATHKEMIMKRFHGILIGSMTALFLSACNTTGMGSSDMGGSSATGAGAGGSSVSGTTNGSSMGTSGSGQSGTGSPGTTGASGQGAGATSTTPPTTSGMPPTGQR